MKRYLLFWSIIFSVLVFNCQTTKKNGNLLSPEQLQTKLSNNDSGQLIDVRTPQEYEEGHLPNAVNIDISSADFISEIGKLKRDKPVYVYCRSGKRSAKSAIQFEKAGFTEIYDLEGGILNWTKENHKIVFK